MHVHPSTYSHLIISNLTEKKMKIKLNKCVVSINNDAIGKGTFSSVYRGIEETSYITPSSSPKSVIMSHNYCDYEDSRDDTLNNLLAIKIINMRNSEGSLGFYREINALQRLKSSKSHNKYIVYIKDSTESIIGNNSIFFHHSAISMSCAICDLFEVIKTSPMVETVARTYFKQIMEAVQHIHSIGIYHRDIKLENLLFYDNYRTIKLSDFGLAHVCSCAGNSSVYDNDSSHNGVVVTDSDLVVGSEFYIAPEILLMNISNNCNSNGNSKSGGSNSNVVNLRKADIWSVGVTLFIMVSGHPPFYSHCNDNDIFFQRIKNKDYDSFWNKEYLASTNGLSNALKSFIIDILMPDPDDRLSSESIKSHPWMDQSNSSTVYYTPILPSTMHSVTNEIITSV